MPWKSTGISLADVADGSMREVFVGEQPVLLVRHGGAVLAFQGRCPHEGGVLADGTLEADRLICPLHGATFAVPGGRILADPDGITPPSGDVDSLVAFPTRTTSGGIEVDLP